MSNAKKRYDKLRPLIVWLGLTELGWIACWLLSGGNDSASFVGIVVAWIVVAWIVVMLAWLAIVIYAGLDGFFLKHTNKPYSCIKLTAETGMTTCFMAVSMY